MSQSVSTGYLAFYGLLDGLYAVTQSDEIASLLGEMSLLADGISADAAAWDDWKRLEREATPAPLLETAIAFLDALLLDSPEIRDCQRLLRDAIERKEESLIWLAFLRQLSRAENGEIDARLKFVD